jgi:peptidoglycan/LPS O-acetylase OafA/YrhL
MTDAHPAVRWAAQQTATLAPSDAPAVARRAPDAIRRSLGAHLDEGFRPDIEGLRAIAVIAVVLYHAQLLGVHGGFVGVDVFFVLSGFLITRLILGELAATGRLALRAFWARRARRLLAASALVLVVTAIATHLILPPLSQGSVVVDTVAAATFTSNIVFAHRLGTYFGAQLGESTPSPLLHFWSLSVEEQFYLCWPPLLAVLTRRPRQYRRLLLIAIAVFGTTGFVLAAWLTPRAPSWAFYLLPTRMGELLAGALLAVLGTQVRQIPPAARAAMAWLGVAVIVVICFRFDETMPWPGTAVLVPVVATMAVIVGGGVAGLSWGPTRVLGVGVLQWVGRHSYAIYLWHWPVLVFAAARGGPLSWQARVVAIVIAVGLAALSYQLIEQPVRHDRWLAAVPARGLAFGAAMILVGLTAAWGLARSIPDFAGGQVAATPQLLPAAGVPAPTAATTATTATAGAPAATVPAGTAPATTLTTATPATPVAPDLRAAPGEVPGLVASLQQALATASVPAAVPANLRPSLAHARDHALPYDQDCVNIGRDPTLKPCDFGVVDAPRTIVLYGDSHAVQWFEPLQKIALQRGYRLVLLAKGGCPVTDVSVKTPILHTTCPPYRDAAIQWIDQHDPSVVIVSDAYTQYDDDAPTWAAGADKTMARLTAVAPHVVVIGDNPTSRTDPPSCLSASTADAAACATTRERAVRTDRIAGESAAAGNHGATFIDTTDWFCTPTTCPVVVGDLLVLRDQTHLTPPMAEFLTPVLDAALAPVLAAAG